MIDIVIVGGGPSGMAAAYEAVSKGARVVVLERLDRVGGLARTIEFRGSLFDIGPHRFFTNNAQINSLFLDVVGKDVVKVPRLTRIAYGDKYFNYPLTPFNALFGIGVGDGISILTSYAAARARRLVHGSAIDNFEDWVIDKFGRQLYETFFKTYTEKVWGIPCTQIGADWASQRIKGLSLSAVIADALLKQRGNSVKTLIDEFMYPRLGAGQTYQKMAELVTRRGSTVRLSTAVRDIRHDRFRVRALITEDGQAVEGTYYLVSAPLTEMIQMMNPPAPTSVLEASRALRYRDHVAVNLLVEGRTFPDNWIYVHSAGVAIARVSNYANFSAAMASRPGINPITAEYFTFPGDEIWQSTNEALIERATRELVQMKVVRRDQITGGFVVRSDKAYPVIEIGYRRHVEVIKQWLDQFTNLLPIGRSGMFKYNNQDHAMATGLLAAQTALGIHCYDPWLVNIDAKYQEGTPAFE